MGLWKSPETGYRSLEMVCLFVGSCPLQGYGVFRCKPLSPMIESALWFNILCCMGSGQILQATPPLQSKLPGSVQS